MSAARNRSLRFIPQAPLDLLDLPSSQATRWRCTLRTLATGTAVVGAGITIALLGPAAASQAHAEGVDSPGSFNFSSSSSGSGSSFGSSSGSSFGSSSESPLLTSLRNATPERASQPAPDPAPVTFDLPQLAEDPDPPAEPGRRLPDTFEQPRQSAESAPVTAPDPAPEPEPQPQIPEQTEPVSGPVDGEQSPQPAEAEQAAEPSNGIEVDPGSDSTAGAPTVEALTPDGVTETNPSGDALAGDLTVGTSTPVTLGPIDYDRYGLDPTGTGPAEDLQGALNEQPLPTTPDGQVRFDPQVLAPPSAPAAVRTSNPTASEGQFSATVGRPGQPQATGTLTVSPNTPDPLDTDASAANGGSAEVSGRAELPLGDGSTAPTISVQGSSTLENADNGATLTAPTGTAELDVPVEQGNLNVSRDLGPDAATTVDLTSPIGDGGPGTASVRATVPDRGENSVSLGVDDALLGSDPTSSPRLGGGVTIPTDGDASPVVDGGLTVPTGSDSRLRITANSDGEFGLRHTDDAGVRRSAPSVPIREQLARAEAVYRYLRGIATSPAPPAPTPVDRSAVPDLRSANPPTTSTVQAALGDNGTLVASGVSDSPTRWVPPTASTEPPTSDSPEVRPAPATNPRGRVMTLDQRSSGASFPVSSAALSPEDVAAPVSDPARSWDISPPVQFRYPLTENRSLPTAGSRDKSQAPPPPANTPRESGATGGANPRAPWLPRALCAVTGFLYCSNQQPNIPPNPENVGGTSPGPGIPERRPIIDESGRPVQGAGGGGGTGAGGDRIIPGEGTIPSAGGGPGTTYTMPGGAPSGGYGGGRGAGPGGVGSFGGGGGAGTELPTAEDGEPLR